MVPSTSLPTLFCLLPGGSLFCSARTSESIRHRVITFVARVLKDRLLTDNHGKLPAPRPRKRRGIVDRKLIQDRVEVHASQAFRQMQAFIGSIEVALADE